MASLKEDDVPIKNYPDDDEQSNEDDKDDVTKQQGEVMHGPPSPLSKGSVLKAVDSRNRLPEAWKIRNNCPSGWKCKPR